MSFLMQFIAVHLLPIYFFAHLHTQTYTHTYTHTHAHTHTHRPTHAHTQTRTHSHTETHTRTHAHTHAHTHKHTHTAHVSVIQKRKAAPPPLSVNAILNHFSITRYARGKLIFVFLRATVLHGSVFQPQHLHLALVRMLTCCFALPAIESPKSPC